MTKDKENGNPFTTKLFIEASEIRFNRTYYHLGVTTVEKIKPTSIWMKPHILKGIVNNLSPSAKDMIFYIMTHIGHNREAIQIEYVSYCEKTGLDITLRTFQRAIVELTNRVIEKKAARKNMYYINPDFLFKGSRINAYPDKVHVTYTEPSVLDLRRLNVIPPERDKDIKSNLDHSEDEIDE